MMYLIRDTTNPHSWWSNADGWGGFTTATPFTATQHEQVNLPLDGEWVEWSKEGLKS